MTDKTPEQIVEDIPEDMRGKVWHALGEKLRHKDGAEPQSGGTPITPPKNGLPGHG